tara:strand:+ start:96 stop:632 length:537 start_codon:yes stop_codon:yes gene_type:complete
MRKIAKYILFDIIKWKLVGNYQFPKKCIFIVAPHTHWVDFFIAIIIRKVINQEINFIGKEELFKFPLGSFLRYMGGEPVKRNSKANTVDIISDIFSKKKQFRLGISPEGTRKKVQKWKTGFYYIAKKANVPIISVTLNFKDKETKFSEPFYITNNIETDFRYLKSFFYGVKGKIPEYS